MQEIRNIQILIFLLLTLVLGRENLQMSPVEISKGGVTYPLSKDTEFEEYNGTFPDYFLKEDCALKIEFSVDDTTKTKALFLSPNSYSTVITLNDLPVYSWGTLEDIVSMTNFGAETIVLGNLKNGVNTVVVYLHNDGKIMPLPHVYIDSYNTVAKASTKQTLFNLYLVQAISLASLFAGLLFLGYSFASGMDDRDIFYFAFYAFSIFMGYTHFVMNSPVTNDLFWFKMSRVGYILAPYFLFLFASEYTKMMNKRHWKILLLFFTIPSALFFIESKSQGILGERFSILSVLYIIPGLVLSYVLMIKYQIVSKSISNQIILIGYTLFFVAVFYDITHVVVMKDPYAWVTPYGYFTIIISIVSALALRYYYIHEDVLKYKADLQMTNEALVKANSSLLIESKSKEDFFKAISHEFRTPLHGMSGIIHNLIENSGKSDDNIKEKHHILASSFYRFELIVQNLLDYEALKADNLDIRNNSFDPYDTINSVLDMFEDSARTKDISLISLVEPGSIPAMLVGDNIRISLVLKNLIQNAIKFTGSGGVSVNALYKSDILEIEVADTGCGIADTAIHSIFKAFKQGTDPEAFNQKYEGMGLGLSIVDAIVNAMGGTISLSSNEGKGSRFTVSIPIKQAVHTVDRTNNLSILIVDDNQINLSVAQMQVEKFGCYTATAENGQEAVEKAQDEQYDLVLMDVQMPVMDGLEATRRIKALYPSLPIVGITANAKKSECIEAGMDDVIFKPASTDTIFNIISRYAKQVNSEVIV